MDHVSLTTARISASILLLKCNEMAKNDFNVDIQTAFNCHLMTLYY